MSKEKFWLTYYSSAEEYLEDILPLLHDIEDHDDVMTTCLESRDDFIIPIINVLKSSNNDAACLGAGEVLGEYRDSRAIEPLIETLSIEAIVMNDVVTTALTKIGDAAKIAMINALTHQNWEVRAGVAAALGRLKEKQAVEGLIRSLEDENKIVVWRAIWALGEIGDTGALPHLIELKNLSSDEEINNILEHAISSIQKHQITSSGSSI